MDAFLSRLKNTELLLIAPSHRAAQQAGLRCQITPDRVQHLMHSTRQLRLATWPWMATVPAHPISKQVDAQSWHVLAVQTDQPNKVVGAVRIVMWAPGTFTATQLLQICLLQVANECDEARVQTAVNWFLQAQPGLCLMPGALAVEAHRMGTMLPAVLSFSMVGISHMLNIGRGIVFASMSRLTHQLHEHAGSADLCFNGERIEFTCINRSGERFRVLELRDGRYEPRLANTISHLEVLLRQGTVLTSGAS